MVRFIFLASRSNYTLYHGEALKAIAEKLVGILLTETIN